MTTRDTLAALVRAYPDGASIPVPKSWLQELLSGDAVTGASANGSSTDIEVDLDCARVAALLSRSASTVRNWCAAGVIPGAYRLRGGREWRVPRSALIRFQHCERQRASQPAHQSSESADR
jgi:helix-turn-helix protein